MEIVHLSNHKIIRGHGKLQSSGHCRQGFFGGEFDQLDFPSKVRCGMDSFGPGTIF